ncbi:MAG: tetraacyldisaccharide 4'-kinase [Alphaproteobacteria bacterium]|nr:tetraacyldisaccharide 4'-kinase [Alphaproteobacteria bacterium]
MKTPYWFMHKTILAFLLTPIAGVYYFISRMVYRIRARRAYVPRRAVICIGNILAGGVGKTPIVRMIAKYMKAPVVMRGYKSGKNTSNIGDEALMLARDGLAVHTGHRKSNVMLLDRQSDDTPIVMDDGFQNPGVKKTISILVFDENIGIGNGFLIPAGPLRETPRAIRRADAIIIIRGARNKMLRVKIPENIPIFYAENQTVSPYDACEKLFAFAGIGYPRKFFSVLSNVVGTRVFADHYQYTESDIEKLINDAARHSAKLITTEKDWVRLPKKYQRQIKFAELNTTIDSAFFEWLKGKVNGYSNKKN